MSKTTKTIRIRLDDDAESPREYAGEFSTMACWHNRYNLGDVQPREEPQEWLKENAPKGSVVLCLYLYDHSGITMSTGPFSCGWDSGPVGYIVSTPEQIRATFMVKRITKKIREQVTKNLENEVKVYAEYLEGNVYGFEIIETTECDSCQHGEPEVIDSCWGFIGNDWALEAMADHIDPELRPQLEQAWENRFDG